MQSWAADYRLISFESRSPASALELPTDWPRGGGVIAQGQLPVHASSSVFLLQDSARPDKMRAIITGPADTPYAGGCFLFDLFIPAEYPNVPPLVHFCTTGAGRVRPIPVPR